MVPHTMEQKEQWAGKGGGSPWGVVGTCVTVLNSMLQKDLLEMKFEQTLEGGE